MDNDALKLIDPREFRSAWHDNLSRFPTYKEAYFDLEEKYRSVFGKNRYSSYDSFRISTSRMTPSIEIW